MTAYQLTCIYIIIGLSFYFRCQGNKQFDSAGLFVCTIWPVLLLFYIIDIIIEKIRNE